MGGDANSMKKLLSIALCAALLLAACAAPAPPPDTIPGASSAGSSPAASQGPATAPTTLPPLRPQDPSALPEEAQSWWFGKQRDDENRPVACVEAQEKYGSLGLTAFVPGEKAAYLTFDFGYETGYSAPILDTLSQKKAKATFFVVEGYLDETDTLRRMIQEGHSVGGHSTTHPGGPSGLAGYSPGQQEEELAGAAGRLAEEYGYQTRLFRFPEGLYSPAALARAARAGQHSIFWSYAYRDWEADDQPGEAQSLQDALDAAFPGIIYLLHPMATNNAILDDLIDGLRAAGYEIKAL